MALGHSYNLWYSLPHLRSHEAGERMEETPMSHGLDCNIETLRRRHAALDQAVESAAGGLAADDPDVKEMKKEKLRLKDEIARRMRTNH